MVKTLPDLPLLCVEAYDYAENSKKLKKLLDPRVENDAPARPLDLSSPS